MKSLLGNLFKPLNPVFKGAIVKRNADMTRTLQGMSVAFNMHLQNSKDISEQNQQTQIDIARSQQETQFAIAYQQLQQAKEIEEQRDQLQMKLAYLQISNQATMEKDRQKFEINLEANRQGFQEKMEHLRFQQQISLEDARQEFQVKMNALNNAKQAELTQFVQEVNLAISDSNLNFQKWKTEEELSLQKELTSCNQQVQLALAAYHRETMFLSPEINKIYENWPLTLLPSQILSSQINSKLTPLRVVLSPPEVAYDQFNNSNQRFPKLEKRLAEDLGQFLSSNYPLSDLVRPVELLDGAWESKRFRGGASIKSLFGMLKSEPMLILESEIDGKFLNFRVAYWGLGQDNYCYERIISRLPYQDILHESAKSRALKWKDTRSKLLELRMGENLEEIDEKYGQDNPHNLKQLEAEEQLRQAGLDYQQMISYQISSDDWEFFCKFLVTCHRLVTSWIADAHYLIHHDADLLMPEVIADIFIDQSSTFTSDIMSSIVSSYKELFEAVKVERSYRVPELAIKLAKCLALLNNRDLADEMLDYSVQSRLEM